MPSGEKSFDPKVSTDQICVLKRRYNRSMKLELSDQDILSRLQDLGDSFVERKTEGDSGDWLKTIVAFANSAPIGYPAFLFIGVKDDGKLPGLNNPDSVQKSLSGKMTQCFPVPYFLSRLLQVEGKHVLAVIVPGSENRPHFAGPAFVRDGSKTVVASETQFGRLIAQRSSAAYELLKRLSKTVSIWHPSRNRQATTYHPSTGYTAAGTITDCNQFYVTIEGTPFGKAVSFGLDAFDIGFDHNNKRLELRFRSPF
jgi:hypothetical protein